MSAPPSAYGNGTPTNAHRSSASQGFVSVRQSQNFVKQGQVSQPQPPPPPQSGNSRGYFTEDNVVSTQNVVNPHSAVHPVQLPAQMQAQLHSGWADTSRRSTPQPSGFVSQEPPPPQSIAPESQYISKGSFQGPSTQPNGLGGLLEYIEGAGPAGLVQVHCDTLHSAVTALLRHATEQGATIGSMQGTLQAVTDAVGGLPDEATFREMHTRMENDNGMHQMMADVQARLSRVEADGAMVTRQQRVIESLERRVADAEQRSIQSEQTAGRIDALHRRIDQLETRMESVGAGVAPNLADNIQDMLATCQNLATKQSDTVAVVTQAYQRVETLESAMSAVQDVVSKLCDSQKQVHNLYAIFESPGELGPHLGTEEDRLQLLLSLPVFQYLLRQLGISMGQAAAPHTPQQQLRSSTMEPEANSMLGNGILVEQHDDMHGEAPVPHGMDRSALEAADKLVAQLTQAMSNRREPQIPVQQVRIPGGRQSPRAREFRSASPATSPRAVMTAAVQGGHQGGVTPGNARASVRSGSSEDPEASLLGIEVADSEAGVVVTRIYQNSPSSVGGLRAGDRIVSFNGANIAVRADFLRALARTRQSQLVPIIFVPQSGTTPVATHLVIGGLTGQGN